MTFNLAVQAKLKPEMIKGIRLWGEWALVNGIACKMEDVSAMNKYVSSDFLSEMEMLFPNS